MSKAILLHPNDNVATALGDLVPGELANVGTGNVKVSEAVPFGHKVALKNIASGAEIIKYGEVIGLALKDIASGGYVHIHNIESQRGRGDLQEKTK
jgi:altronate dehydratase small subunit